MALTDQAILTIKEMILSGELQPGQKLPPEHDLGIKLGLSRNSLREAVKALAVVGVLDVRRGDGTYVTDLSSDYLAESLSFILELHQDSSMLEFFEVRRILEAAAVEKATVLAIDKDLAELQDQLDDIREVIDASANLASNETINQLVDHDQKFHQTILELAGNSYLAGLAESLSSHTTRVRIWRGISETDAISRTIVEHQAILNAMVSRDPSLAKAAVIHHIGGVEEFLKKATSR